MGNYLPDELETIQTDELWKRTSRAHPRNSLHSRQGLWAWWSKAKSQIRNLFAELTAFTMQRLSSSAPAKAWSNGHFGRLQHLKITRNFILRSLKTPWNYILLEWNPGKRFCG